MTSNNAARLSAIQSSTEQPAGGDAQAEAAAVEQVEQVERLCDSVLALLSGLDRAPSSLRIRADQVEIAMDWPVAGSAATSAAAPVVPVADPAIDPVTSAVSAVSAASIEAGWHVVTAQLVGVFYRAPEPGAPPYVGPGDRVTAGQQVGLIEAMKLMIPVEADVAGVVVEVLAGNGEPIEFGDPLLAIEPS